MASALQLLSNLSSPVSILKGGTALQTRPRINIIEGSNVTIVATDDSVNYKTDITINSAGSGSGGTVTSVDGSGGTTGLTVTGGPITTTGTLTLGGTLGVANGGTGKTTFSTAGYVKANGTTALTSVSSIPGTDITGDISGTASNVTGIVAVVNGGTGSNSASTARTALGLAIGTDVLAPNGSAASLTSFPTLDQNTTGTASNVTGTVAIANGGTGQTTRQNALNALGGAVTSGYYLRGDGTNLSLSALSATDFATGILDVAYGGTGTTSYTAGYVKASGTSAFTTVSTVSGSDVSGNIAGTASNVSGIVAIANGGTGAFSAAGAISNLGLGTLATQNGVFSGVSSGTNTGDQTITLTGDATGSGTGSFAVTVGKINGTALSGLSTGILKNTTTTGVPSIAVAGDFPTLNQNTSGSSASCTGNAATATALATARAINGTNFDGTAAISISATATGTGAVARTINNRASDVFNVKDYGAVGDGSSDDNNHATTGAINKAVAAAVASGTKKGLIYFPAGIYKISVAISAPSNPQCNIVFCGDGANESVIKQVTAGANGISISLGTSANQMYTADFRDLSFLADAVCGAAISVTYGTTPTTSYHLTAGCSFVRCNTVAQSSSKYWGNGILLENGWNAFVSDCFLANWDTNPTWSGNAVELKGMCVNFRMHNTGCNFWNKGFCYTRSGTSSTDQNTEGICINQCIMVAVNYGVYILGNPNFVIGSPALVDAWGRNIGGKVALVSFINGHIDQRGDGHGIYLENVQTWLIGQSLIITTVSTQHCVHGINAYEGTAVGNSFYGPLYSHVYLDDKSNQNVITGNTWRGANEEIYLTASVNYNKIFGNVKGDSATTGAIIVGGTVGTNILATPGN